MNLHNQQICGFLKFWFFCLLFTAKICHSIKWLGMQAGARSHWRRNDCERIQSIFSSKQRKICRSNVDLMKYVADSAELTKEECKEQFRSRTWDCSSIDSAPRFGLDLAADTKEAGFVYALSTAALTFTVSKACLSGKLASCGCKNKAIFVPSAKAPEIRQRDFGGCPDITLKGSRFAKQFAIAELRKKQMRSALAQRRNKVKKHNIKIGGQVVRELLSVNCRCHGVTGACQMKHCMKRLPTFQEVARTLKQRYDKAVKIDMQLQRNGFKKQPRMKGLIVYTDTSPNYCIANQSLGTSGTTGRECLLDPNAGKQSCEKLCCGRGFHTQKIEIVERCKCRYIWCCEVKCQICKSTRLQHTCR